MAVYDQGHAPFAGDSRAGLFINLTGAALSLALIAGICVWGYKLIIRDVSGIPVVRAMEGDMRVLPDNPGGELGLHTGLAVNAVAAVGEAAGPEDRLVLAPATEGLAEEDLDVQLTAEAAEVLPTALAPANDQQMAARLTDTDTVATQVAATPLTTDDILALADQIAAGIEPLSELPPAQLAIAVSIPGVAVSLRPAPRPDDLNTALTAPGGSVVTTTEFPAGTKLVQLGAYPSAAVAVSEWVRLSAQFGPLMSDKERVIQRATRSGDTFYRLRATGFSDLGDAQRFCVALVAEDAECITIVVN